MAGNLFFESIEEDIKNKETFVQEQNRKNKEIHDSYNLLIEYKTVLRRASKIIQFQGRGMMDDENIHSLNGEGRKEEQEEAMLPVSMGGIAVGHIAGTINSDETLRFKKLIFRATRGNALCYFDYFKSPLIDFDGKPQKKSVYVVIFQEGGSLRERIMRI